MAGKTNSQASAQQAAQNAWGSGFRLPGFSAQPRKVVDQRNRALAATILNTAPVPLNTQTLDQQDILTGLQLELSLALDYGGADVADIVQSPLAPYNWINNINISFETAWSSVNLPGYLAYLFNQFRPTQWGAAYRQTVGPTQNGADTGQSNFPAAGLVPSLTDFSLPGTGYDHTKTTWNTQLDLPLSIMFDLYYDLAANGPVAGSAGRCIVSPQLMAGSQRNVEPIIQLAAALPPSETGELLTSPFSVPSGDTITFSGTASGKLRRVGYFAPGDSRRIPVVRNWQYSRVGLSTPVNQQPSVNVPLNDSSLTGGQILAVIFAVWDPTLNSGSGGFMDVDNITEVQLIGSSTVVNIDDSVGSNSETWLAQHGTLLAPGFLGFDRAITEDGQLTNEWALNTLTTNGINVQLNFVEAPGAGSRVITGVEMLRSVPYVPNGSGQ